jgi:hypothetical protein
MYQKTQNCRFKDIVYDYVNRHNQVEGMQGFVLLKALSFLYEETREERYISKISELIHLLIDSNRKSGRLVPADRANYSSYEIYCFMPTYAWYETNYNKKQHYIDIMEQLSYLNTIEFSQRNLFLMTLADTTLSISEEIYEYYALIKAWLKEGVHRTLVMDEGDSIEKAYVILKGCQSKALLPEKYEEIGKSMVREKAASLCDIEKEVRTADLGVFMMAYAML